MAQSRRDNKGRVLNKRESQGKDLKYRYQYIDPYGVRRSIYANTLKDLREREKELIKDLLDGIDTYCAGSSTLNYVFDRYRKQSPRIDIAVEPYPNRWTHHVMIGSVNEIDEELMSWICEAADFAVHKGRS